MNVSTPDPTATSAAQSKINRETAETQQGLNMVDQVGPDGTLRYERAGNMDVGGSTVPHYQATTTLSPSQQALYDTNNTTKQNIAQIGATQSDKIGSLLNTPIDLNSASETKYEQMARSRLDPLWAQKRQQNETDLINRGIRPGSEGYNTMMGQFGQQQNDAYNSMYVAGKGMFDQEALTERNQPINEISALMSGSQVSMPNFISTPQTQVANTDFMGAAYNSANAKNSANNAMMGGLFGLAGSGLTAGIKYGIK